MASTRRQFLATAGSASLIGFGSNLPGFLLRAAEAPLLGGKERILIVVQLTGGNDGLNTVVPHADELYYKSRPKLAVPKAQVLKINDQIGLSPNLSGCAKLVEENRLAIVQGVGYDNPNRSHFESMDIWHMARREKGTQPLGWLGRHLDATAAGPNTGDAPALHLGGEVQPLALCAAHVRVPSVDSLERFKLNLDGQSAKREAIQAVVSQERPEADDLLGFVQQGTSAALASSQRVEQVLGDYKTPVKYPESSLGRKLRSVAQLISAGLSTRIYYVELDGFDTHSNQAGGHTALLKEFDGAVGALVDDLAQQGNLDRSLVMSFSEFGRRVQENASEGTDHGAAAPMFLIGSRVKPGATGAHPSLSDLDDGDLKHHTDFRRVYAAVLERWLGQKSSDILGDGYAPLDVLPA